MQQQLDGLCRRLAVEQMRSNSMKKILVGALALALSAVPSVAQSMEDLNIQIHGFATQGFLYSTQNDILSTNSTSGNAGWTEAVNPGAVGYISKATPHEGVKVLAVK
jgi:hypothetical protein